MKIQPPSQRTIPTLLIAISFTLICSLLGAQPARAALMAIPTNVSVVYLTGTETDWDGDCPTNPGSIQNSYSIQHALDVRWLHQRLVTELKIDPNKAISLNYYCNTSFSPRDRTKEPAVVPVTEEIAIDSRGKPIKGCLSAAKDYVEPGRGDRGKTNQPRPFPEPVIRHAYHVAWWLAKKAKEDPQRKFLLIGHSQGGILMRLIHILSEKSRRNEMAPARGPKILDGRYGPDCWPDLPQAMFFGSIFMGAPTLGGTISDVSWAACLGIPGFDTGVSFEICDCLNNLPPPALSDFDCLMLFWPLGPFGPTACKMYNTARLKFKTSVTRQIINKYSKLQSPTPVRQIQLGGSPEEKAGLGAISAQSSTALPGGVRYVIARQKNASGKNLDMEHADWFNGNQRSAGNCPRDQFNYCFYIDFSQKTPIQTKITKSDNPKSPGNVYDLIISTMKNKW